MREKIFQYSEIEYYLQKYTPKTPYGIADKRKRELCFDKDRLENLYELLERSIQFVSDFPERIDKIEYHLKKIPRLEETLHSSTAFSEIYNVKKFLINYKKITELLSGEMHNLFRFTFHSDILLRDISGGLPDDEIFYISDSFSEELAVLRTEIVKIDEQLKQIKADKISDILERFNIDFRFHDFLVLSEESIPSEADNAVYIESYDSLSVLIKPILGIQYYDVQHSRKDLIEREKDIEDEIKKHLLEKIKNEKEVIEIYIENILKLDTVLAKAKLAIASGSVRPEFSNSDSLHIVDAVFVPLKEENQKKNRKYKPLSGEFDQRNIVISGSNMGGKTILLKTVLFCQLLSQLGFFVPARRFSTHLFRNINLIGDLNLNRSGLSSFAEEIVNLMEAENSGKTLYIIDEFARTTNAAEGKALYCSILNWFSESDNICSFSSTHQENLPPFQNLSYWLMKGLDYGKYRQYYHKDYNCDLNERISLINDYMDYGVAPRNKSEKNRDALKIADILGLDSEIIQYAENYIKNQE